MLYATAKILRTFCLVVFFSMHLRQLDVLAENGKVSVIRSPGKGIIDFYLDGELIDNGVLITTVDGNVNFSEINGVNPELIVKDTPDTCTLRYAFPNGAVVDVAITVRRNFPQITAALTVLPISQPVQELGLGNFFGVLHDFDRIRVNGKSVYAPDRFLPLGPTDYFQTGNFRELLGKSYSIESYNSRTLHPLMYQSADTGAEARVEIRDVPWSPDHDIFRQNNGATGAWFEMQVLIFRNVQPGETRVVYLGMR